MDLRPLKWERWQVVLFGLSLPWFWAFTGSTSAQEVQSVVLRLLNEATLSAGEAGIITAIHVREGDAVKRGDVIAQVDDRVARLAQQAAELELKVAREKAANDVAIRYATKAHEVAQAELDRSHESIRKFAGSVSQSQLDVERLTVDKSLLEREQATHHRAIEQLDVELKLHAVAAAQVQVSRRQINAPFDGMIVEVFVRTGEWIEPGTKAVRLVDIGRLKAEGFISADQADPSLMGAEANVVAANTDTTAERFQGTITFVSPEIDPITDQVRVSAEIDNHEHRLRPGQRVRMWIGQERVTQHIDSGPGMP
jgi:macrolide-specific efflux system membrane fusion protein